MRKEAAVKRSESMAMEARTIHMRKEAAVRISESMKERKEEHEKRALYK